MSSFLKGSNQLLIKLFSFVYATFTLFALFNYCSRCYVTMPPNVGEPRRVDRSDQGKCHIDWSALGTVNIDVSHEPSIEVIEARNKEVNVGGSWKPTTCKAWQKVAIVIPYRSRWCHLKQLLDRLHPMLQKQNLEYRIFVIEQAGMSNFNRGKLMNVGYLEALHYAKYQCFVFHDVDLIPENNKNLYMCDEHARHLSSAINEMRYHVLYYNYMGGVVAINRENMRKINGYSNMYWGWGNEDDDLSARTQEAGLLLTRPPQYIGRYKMVRHIKDSRAEHGNKLFLEWRQRWPRDGLNDAHGMNYSILVRKEQPLYTNITVNVGTDKLRPNSVHQKETLWCYFRNTQNFIAFLEKLADVSGFSSFTILEFRQTWARINMVCVGGKSALGRSAKHRQSVNFCYSELFGQLGKETRCS